MKKSIQIINPATTSEDGNAVVIYDRAFGNPTFSLDQVITHEIGHILYLRLALADRDDYLHAMGWKSELGGSFTPRSNNFISSRSKDDPFEDFAENISFFLMAPMKLKSEVPKAHQWISIKFINNFKMKPECQLEKI